MNKFSILLLALCVNVIAGCSDSQSSDKHVQVTFQQVIRSGATFCLDRRSMQKVQVMERINNPYVQMPPDCNIAAQPIPVQTQGDDPMGFVIVYNDTGRALVQKKDLETIQIKY
ncbi:hypothetical protein D3C87_164080 [compost metagenome]